MKKQMRYGLFLMVLTFLFTACGYAKYENLHTSEDKNVVAIVWGETVYEFYGFVGNDGLTDKQIGIIDDDKNHKVYRVKGYSDADWLLTELAVFMEQGTYSLYKAQHVKEIPADFVLDSDAESSFLENYQ